MDEFLMGIIEISKIDLKIDIEDISICQAERRERGHILNIQY